MPSLHDFATWEPVLRLLRSADAESIAAPGGYVAGRSADTGRACPCRGGARSPDEPSRSRTPDELKVLYRVARARWEDWGDDYERAERVSDAVGCELFSLDELYLADAPSRPSPWKFAAMKAVGTPSDAAVRGLVGSPGWIVFGDNGGGDRVAVDLTPGPHGHADRSSCATMSRTSVATCSPTPSPTWCRTDSPGPSRGGSHRPWPG